MNHEFTESTAARIARMMAHLKEVSIPRLVGSEGEKSTQKYLKQKIEEMGYTVQTEPVPTSLYRINFLQGFSNFMAALLCVISALLFSIHPLLFIIPIILIFINISMVSKGSVDIGQAPDVPAPWKKKIIWTENIFAETSNDPSNIEVVFVGHYDSKSNRLTGFMRAVFYIILLLCAFLILISGIIGIFGYFHMPPIVESLKRVLWVCALISVVSAIILAGNVVANESIGVADNGTAIVLLLELMQYFKEKPLGNANITFLFSAAEEIGLTGAWNFIKNRENQERWNPKRAFIINYDLAGLKGPLIFNDAIGIPKTQVAPEMTKMVEEVAQEQRIEIKKGYLPIGGWTDALPFIERKYLTATFSGLSTKIHSMGDNFDIISEDNLYKSFVLGAELAKKISNLNKK